jgi:hypothetical protein
MKTSAVVSAAALLALGAVSTAHANPVFHLSGLSPLVHKVGCWDECEEFLEAVEEAREEAVEARAAAREAAEEAAAEYAEERESYGYRPQRSGRQARAMEQPDPTPKAKGAKDSTPKSSDGKASDNKPKAPLKTKDVAANGLTTCKQYSPATGMLLSVPCE